MKPLLIRTVFVVLVVMVAALPAMAQYGACRVDFTMLNSTRHVVGDVSQECHGFRRPFGNWGVESNFGQRNNTFQFAGWKYHDNNTWQWNSCTVDIPREGTCGVHYNHDHNGNGLCEDQGGLNTEYAYAAWSVYITTGCPKDTNYDGRCDTGGVPGCN